MVTSTRCNIRGKHRPRLPLFPTRESKMFTLSACLTALTVCFGSELEAGLGRRTNFKTSPYHHFLPMCSIHWYILQNLIYGLFHSLVSRGFRTTRRVSKQRSEDNAEWSWLSLRSSVCSCVDARIISRFKRITSHFTIESVKQNLPWCYGTIFSVLLAVVAKAFSGYKLPVLIPYFQIRAINTFAFLLTWNNCFLM